MSQQGRLPYREDTWVPEPAPVEAIEERIRVGRQILSLCDGDATRAERWLRRSNFTESEIEQAINKG
jgi:hypothetical protein